MMISYEYRITAVYLSQEERYDEVGAFQKQSKLAKVKDDGKRSPKGMQMRIRLGDLHQSI